MRYVKKSAAAALLVVVLLPLYSFGAESRMSAIPLIQMLQENKVKVSPDKRTMTDLNGSVVARETPPPVPKKVEPTANPFEKPQENTVMVVNCNKKCGMVSRKCFLDEIGNTICLNICDKESYICEEAN